MADWPALARWTWPFLSAVVGDRAVAVYDDWFEPVGVARFHDVLAEITEGGGTRSYIRLASRTRPADERWADDVFDALACDWRQPAFLPRSGYIVPARVGAADLDASSDPFPYRTILVSARGGRTRLHVDPWTSSAVLCQLSGVKHAKLYDPAVGQRLLEAAIAGAHETDQPPTLELELHAGEILYVPGGWWHDVTTVEASLTLTWNFVHEATAADLAAYVRRYPDDPELDVLEYFLNTSSDRRADGSLAEAIDRLSWK